ncbi:UDP-glucose 4-epimerase GalE [Deinococcus aetherius]|uniref:UDP-glucose 4-epimerase n=1 Tax=Deinococcus aetherius TaxID=200252 RepID=A0ABN6R9V6_9DEIO|nr:UDP-glucose 4-epimerase GalE [Deinococcus aetherius]BDP40130.1 UDP-glucose 4-epimerase GalE [Deinococcus aetherius]
MKVLVTGGAGYIGSTVVSALAEAGAVPVVLDSLVQGRAEFAAGHSLYMGDIADVGMLDRIFAEHPDISTLMHFAARIDVEESTRLPSLYYRENLCKGAALLEEVLRRGVRRVIFSSTAAVYRGGDGSRGLPEDAPTEPLSPYARSKLMFEGVLSDLCAQFGASAVALRYFNPVGADPALRSGPYKPDPSHILGKLTGLAAVGGGEFVINGDDYPTRDGTPVRDYVHVWDLARAHLSALNYVNGAGPGCTVVNVGSGSGVTVREFVDAFMAVTGLPLTVRVGGRRPGDTAGAYADTGQAESRLGWRPERSLEEGIRDALAWEERFRAGGQGVARREERPAWG